MDIHYKHCELDCIKISSGTSVISVQWWIHTDSTAVQYWNFVKL